MPEGWDEGAEDWEVDSEEYGRLERNALFAVFAGVLAMTTAMCAYPSGGLMAFPTILIGLIGLFLGRSVQSTGVDGTPRAYANMAVVTGGIASVWGAMILLICGLLIALYVGMLALIFGIAGNM